LPHHVQQMTAAHMMQVTIKEKKWCDIELERCNDLRWTKKINTLQCSDMSLCINNASSHNYVTNCKHRCSLSTRGGRLVLTFCKDSQQYLYAYNTYRRTNTLTKGHREDD